MHLWAQGDVVASIVALRDCLDNHQKADAPVLLTFNE